MSENLDRSEIERVLDHRYQVVRELGRGAFGAVYLAREVQLHRLVAIKVLHAERVQSDDERERFVREARTIAQLSHPGIVPLLAFHDGGAATYMVMPYVGGESLASVLRRAGRLDPAETRRILIEVADAVAYAHAQGVLHRDIKPENILLESVDSKDDAPPRVRLIDFGVAAFPTRDPGVRASTEMWSTPHFMAPEQAFGEPELDPRSELYALGVLGYLLLGGRLPFEAGSLRERLSQQRKGPAIPLAVLAPTAPRDLVLAIDRCLAYEPEERWTHARDLRDALIAGLEIETRAPLSVIRRRLRGRRRRQAPQSVFYRAARSGLFDVTGLASDLRFAIRTLRNAPLFSLSVALTLAVGFAATTTVFSLIDALVLRPPPVADPGSLVTIEERYDAGGNMLMGATAIAYPRYVQYAQALEPVFAGLAGQSIQSFSLRSGAEARALGGLLTTGTYFEVLGLHPAIGRFYTATDNRLANNVAVVSYDFWKSRLGGDASALGRRITLDSRPMTIIGVAPRGFHGAFGGIYALDVWVPVTAYASGPRSLDASVLEHTGLVVFGRLRPGVTLEAAHAALSVAGPRIPMENARSHVLDAWAEPLHMTTRDSFATTARFTTIIFGIACVVLVIAAANAAGMLLARASTRGREIATRLAIGATRGRVARQLLIESLLVSAAGGLLGLMFTVAGARGLEHIPSPLPWALDAHIGVNLRVCLVAMCGVIVSAVLAGLTPAMYATRVDLASAMKVGGLLESPRRARLRGAFVVAQIAACIAVLAVAGLFARSIGRAARLDPGFDPAGIVVGAISLRPHGYDAQSARVLESRLIERLRARPEIVGAALASDPPLSGNSNGADRLTVPGTTQTIRDVQLTPAGVGFLELLRVRLLAGRTFTNADGPAAPRVAVVNVTLVRRLWPSLPPTAAIGKQIALDGELHTVVGVVGAGKYLFLQEGQSPFAYTAFAQNPSSSPMVFVRGRGSDAAVLRVMREELAALDPNVALERQEPLQAWIDKYIVGQRVATGLVGTFGLVGLILAAAGIYALLAFTVAQRSREFGVRMALGARSADVIRLVLSQVTRLVAIGAIVGIAAALGIGQLIASFLFGLDPRDPVTLVVVPLLLAVVALVASGVPARRATAATPMSALRAE